MIGGEEGERPDGWDVAVLLVAAAVVARVVGGWIARVSYPFDLEWMEGGMLAHAWRLREGLPLYPEPGPDWVPFVYPPGYSALLAALAPVTGLDYAPGRIVSMVGALAAAALLAATVARRGSLAVGAACAAVFLGCWRASGAFYDLVRPDGLSIGLVAGVFFLAREGTRGDRRAQLGAGLLLALAFTVKHHSAAYGAPLAVALWWTAGRDAAARFSLAAAVPAGLFTLAMQVATEGRFVQYLIAVPASHPWVSDRLFPGAFGEVALWLAPAMLAGAAWLLAERRHWAAGVGGLAGAVAVFAAPTVTGVDMPPLVVVALVTAAIGAVGGVMIVRALERTGDARWWTGALTLGTILAVAVAMRAHNGGFTNVLMPLHYGIALGLGLVIVDVRRRYPRARPATAALLGVQLLWMLVEIDVDAVVPTKADVEAGAAVVARLESCPPGPIFSPYASWLPVQAGRAPSLHLITLWDIAHESGPFEVTAIETALNEHHYACVLTGSRQRVGYGVEVNYRVESTFRYEGSEMTAKTGWRVRPNQVLVPRAGP